MAVRPAAMGASARGAEPRADRWEPVAVTASYGVGHSGEKERGDGPGGRDG